MHFGRLFCSLALLLGLALAGATKTEAARSGIDTEVNSPLTTMMKSRKEAARAGEYRVAKKKKALKILGIAAGVAATAIIVNEAAKAERRRKKRARRARARRRNYCHSGSRLHSHGSLGGRYYHRHDVDCIAYRETAAPAPLPPEVVQPSCQAGYEFINGQCYLIDPNRGPGNQQANAVDPYDRCAARYLSFRYEDGTFQPFGNKPRRLCPYLAQ